LLFECFCRFFLYYRGARKCFLSFLLVLDKSFILLLRISRCDGEIKAT